MDDRVAVKAFEMFSLSKAKAYAFTVANADLAHLSWVGSLKVNTAQQEPAAVAGKLIQLAMSKRVGTIVPWWS